MFIFHSTSEKNKLTIIQFNHCFFTGMKSGTSAYAPKKMLKCGFPYSEFILRTIHFLSTSSRSPLNQNFRWRRSGVSEKCRIGKTLVLEFAEVSSVAWPFICRTRQWSYKIIWICSARLLLISVPEGNDAGSASPLLKGFVAKVKCQGLNVVSSMHAVMVRLQT